MLKPREHVASLLFRLRQIVRRPGETTPPAKPGTYEDKKMRFYENKEVRPHG